MIREAILIFAIASGVGGFMVSRPVTLPEGSAHIGQVDTLTIGGQPLHARGGTMSSGKGLYLVRNLDGTRPNKNGGNK